MQTRRANVYALSARKTTIAADLNRSLKRSIFLARWIDCFFISLFFNRSPSADLLTDRLESLNRFFMRIGRLLRVRVESLMCRRLMRIDSLSIDDPVSDLFTVLAHQQTFVLIATFSLRFKSFHFSRIARR